VSFVQLEPPFVETCHCTLGAGAPDAAAAKVALLPRSTVVLVGSAVTSGISSTVSVAAVLVASPVPFVKTARY